MIVFNPDAAPLPFLLVVAALLGASILASILAARREAK